MMQQQFITFQDNGNFGGIGGDPADNPGIQLAFSNDPDTARTVVINMGPVGGRQVTVSAEDVGLASISVDSQDGYSSGQLANLSVTQEGHQTTFQSARYSG